jgi:hypothetical protein
MILAAEKRATSRYDRIRLAAPGDEACDSACLKQAAATGKHLRAVFADERHRRLAGVAARPGYRLFPGKKHDQPRQLLRSHRRWRPGCSGREAPARDGKAGGESDNPCRKSGTPPTQHYQTERFCRCSDAGRNLTAAVALRFGVLHVSTLTLAEAAWARCCCSQQLPSRSCGRLIRRPLER